MKSEIKLRDLMASDVPAIAALHQKCFPESLMTRLGSGVLQHYYAWQWSGTHPFMKAQGAFQGDRLAGFCLSGHFKGATGGFLRKNAGLLGVSLLMRPWLFFNPELFKKIVAGADIFRKSRPEPKPVQFSVKSFGILAIGVDPDFRQAGIGKSLLAEAEKTALSKGVSEMYLTVGPENRNAILFYEKLGWYKDGNAAGWHGEMRKKLRKSDAL